MKLACLLVGMLGLATATWAETGNLGDMPQRLQAATDDLLRIGALGAVLVVDFPSGERISLASGYTDKTREVPLTSQHSFQIASLTKMFTAAGILLLIEDGKIALEDKVTDLFDGYIGDRTITIEPATKSYEWYRRRNLCVFQDRDISDSFLYA